ncbi:MAG: hypothetical protein IKK68_05900 [Paludibacteraceae bacterium]|nr:hypothetical protein [Paludibacteraceae bacterium]
MKRLFLVLASMASIASAIAQDVIVKRDGEEIQCRILEVSSNKVKFKQWKNQNGPTFVEKKADILMLKYENGQKEVISFSGPVGETKVEDAVVAETPVDSVALADTMPISNDYLEYARKEKSGLLKWGRSISEEQAHSVLGKDWTDFTRAHKSERVGRAMIFTGGALIVGGGLWTAQYIWASKDYDDKKSAYENHVAEANANYAAKINSLNDNVNVANAKLVDAQSMVDGAKYALNNAQDDYNNANSAYEQAKRGYEVIGNVTKNQLDAAEAVKNSAAEELASAEGNYNAAKDGFAQAESDVTLASGIYNAYIANGTDNYNKDFYKPSFKSDMDDAKNYKKTTLYPMIGCYASGAALLVWGIIKEKRAHKKVNEIVNRYNVDPNAAPAEIPAEVPTETSWKPEFDMEARGNGLALVMKF